MRRNLISIIAVLCILLSCLSIPANASIYDGVSERDWYGKAVISLEKQGIIPASGVYPVFKPHYPISRADFLIHLSRCVSNFSADPYVIDYDDVWADSYYYDALQWAYRFRIAQGTGNNLFHPGDDITRQEAVKMIYQYAYAASQDMDSEVLTERFSDGDQVADWAKDAMNWAITKGIIKGDNNNMLNPCQELTRAEMAVMLYNGQDLLIGVEIN